jgi:5-methylcytosine-specific restriction endonuclease McrA
VAGRLQSLKGRLATLDTRVGSAQGSTPSWRSDKRGANERGYTYKWQQASKAFLEKHPLCQCPDCEAGEKRVTPATVVDHDPPHRGDMVKFWDRSTWRAMAKACHDRKTQQELQQGL